MCMYSASLDQVPGNMLVCNTYRELYKNEQNLKKLHKQLNSQKNIQGFQKIQHSDVPDVPSPELKFPVDLQLGFTLNGQRAQPSLGQDVTHQHILKSRIRS